MKQLLERYPALKAVETSLGEAIALTVETYRRGNKVLLCGNGGSAADCEHIAGEFLKGFLSSRTVKDGRVPEDLAVRMQGSLPAIPLTSFSAAMTASLNDLDPEVVYAQLLYGFAKEGDLLIAISTSGNAKNVCNAARLAKSIGVNVVSLTGEGGGALAKLATVAICAPATETYRVQEYHLPIYHHLCAAVERALFEN